jgi:hypothetical protein
VSDIHTNKRAHEIENLTFERDQMRLLLQTLVDNVVSVRAGFAVVPASLIHKAEEILETADDDF